MEAGHGEMRRKKVEVVAEKNDAVGQGARSPRLEASSAIFSEEKFQNPLPLEPHGRILVQEEHIHTNENAAVDNTREGRFLGLGNTLCNLGVGSCKQKAKKKKGHGYPHTIQSQYGAPPPHQYEVYETGYQNTAQELNSYNTYPQKQKGHKKKKKGGNGVTDFISGFINSYTKPKKDKIKVKGYVSEDYPTLIVPNKNFDVYGPPPPHIGNHNHHVRLPEYEIPSTFNSYNAPKPTYHVPKPSYNVPKPSYNVPKPSYNAPKPTYHAPKPTYNAPKPSYNAPKPTYNAPKSSYAVPSPALNVHHGSIQKKVAYVGHHASSHQKPQYIVQPNVVTKVLTQTVGSPIDATSVQHLHSHTHVYHGSKVIKPNHHGHIQKKSDNDISGSNTFVNQESSSSFVSNPVNVIKLSPQNNNHNSNPFNTQKSQSTGFSNNQKSHSTGFSTHTQFISHKNGFSADKFQPPAHTEFGFNPSSATVEDMINANHIHHQFSRTIYDSDCHCISEQYCSAENIVQGRRDLSNIINARNENNGIFSNASSTEDSDENKVNSSRSGRSFDLSETTETSDNVNLDDEDLDEATTVTVDITTDVPESSRKRRDTNATENFSDVQGRQLSGYTPDRKGCGSGTVCCKRPTFTNTARSLPVCGRSNDENILGRIKTKNQEVGRAGFAEYPWQAAILKKSGGELVYVCGASLISDRYLITAAHCINNIETGILRVRLGEWDVRDKSEFYPHVESEVSGTYIHPDFYEGNLENDIAVIKIGKPVDYTKQPHISPVCLPPPQSEFTGQTCTITGWGKDGWGSQGEFQAILKETKVPILNHDVCQQVLRTTKLGTTYNLHQGMMCAGGEANKDACKGDGGGPLVCRGSSKEYILAGVVSWGLGCGERGIPGVYVDVAKYVEWVQSITV